MQNQSTHLFLLFMWRSHIPKLEIIFPSEVLVSSDKRPYRNMTFDNVLTRQSSSFCNTCRVLQAFALHDMKMVPQKDCCVDQKMSYRVSFSKYTVLALEEEFISMCRNCRVKILFQLQNSTKDVFVILRPPYLCPSEGHKHGVSIQSSINLGDPLLRIMGAWKTAETWFLARLII